MSMTKTYFDLFKEEIRAGLIQGEHADSILAKSNNFKKYLVRNKQYKVLTDIESKNEWDRAVSFIEAELKNPEIRNRKE